MLGFDLSERTISRWMKRAPRGPDQAKRWLAFLRNHREAIAAMDFFTVANCWLDSILFLVHSRVSISFCGFSVFSPVMAQEHA